MTCNKNSELQIGDIEKGGDYEDYLEHFSEYCTGSYYDAGDWRPGKSSLCRRR